MKTKKYCLILSVITGILCNTALSEVELPPQKYDPLLIGRANPTLAGIDNLHVTITHPDQELNGLVWEKLKAKVNNKLSQAGIKVFSPEPAVMYKLPIWPELKICVSSLELEQCKQYVFHIQTLLAKSIHIRVKPALRQKADVWKTEPVMQAVSAQSVPSKVTEVVFEQIDVFIEAWRAANATDKQPSDANEINIIPKEQIKPTVKEAVSEYKYVASKNSKVFHKSTCTWANRIAPKNLVHYKSREDAINDGKRPCKQCEP